MSTPTEPAPVAANRLIAGAWRETRRTWPALWPFWIASSFIAGAVELTFHLLRPTGGQIGGDTAERLANVTMTAAGQGVVAALALQVLLRQRERAGRLGREHAAYIRGYVLVSVGFVLIDELVWTVAPQPSPALVLPVLVAVLLGGGLLLAPWVLWNVSQLPGTPRLTLAEAWRIAPGGAWAYTVAFCAVGGVPMLAYWMLIAMFDQSGDLVTLGLACGVGVLTVAWDTTMAAVFFRQRLGLARPERLADVFD